jgi:hypothetical protein
MSKTRPIKSSMSSIIILANIRQSCKKTAWFKQANEVVRSKFFQAQIIFASKTKGLYRLLLK